MKKKLFFLFIFLFIRLKLFCVDISSLDKYVWIEKYPNTLGGYTHFYKFENIKDEYELYKMKYYSKKNGYIKYYIFIYNSNEKKYYEIDRMNYSWKSIPLLNFNGLELYEKINGEPESLEGSYKSNTEVISDVEIRKIENRNYIYSITLSYEERGWHLLYWDGNKLKSDNTFGICKEEKLEKMFEVDRAESFYNYRNILSAYTNDNFSLSILENKEFNIKLEINSELNIIPLVPAALFDSETFYVYEETEIYNPKFNQIRKQQKFKEEVRMIQRKYEWIEYEDFYNLFVEVQFPDGTTGWVYSNSLLIY